MPTDFKFRIKPNDPAIGNHLNQQEIAFHLNLLKVREKQFKLEEVVDLLWKDNTVPLWINVVITEVTSKQTIIELITSRRLRPETELNQIVDTFPPFHVQVSLPPAYIKGEKFDINWRLKMNGGKMIWNKLKFLLLGKGSD